MEGFTMGIIKIQFCGQYVTEEPPVYQSGISTIYKAQDMNLHRTVGIKVVDLSGMNQAQRRTLLSEVGVWCDYATLSDRIPHIYAALEQAGKFYIIMQWVPGRTLRQELESGLLSFDQKLDLAIQLCNAMAPIHRKNGRQHKDLKPENLQITEKGKLYLLDFNISAAVSHQGVGTDGYLAPERAGFSQQPGSGRLDVFAIGVILYEMFTGAIPFFGMDYLCDLTDRKWQMFSRPREKDPTIPEKLDNIICKCMNLLWQERYPDAGAIARDLIQLQRMNRGKGGNRG
jgi:serine/threonine-protein kinase